MFDSAFYVLFHSIWIRFVSYGLVAHNYDPFSMFHAPFRAVSLRFVPFRETESVSVFTPTGLYIIISDTTRLTKSFHLGPKMKMSRLSIILCRGATFERRNGQKKLTLHVVWWSSSHTHACAATHWEHSSQLFTKSLWKLN